MPVQETATEAAKALRQDKEFILSRWEKAVRERIKAAEKASSPTLIDTLPLFLDRLAESFCPQTGRDFAGEENTIPLEHGALRAKITHYSISDLIHEYHIFRDIIFDWLTE